MSLCSEGGQKAFVCGRSAYLSTAWEILRRCVTTLDWEIATFTEDKAIAV